MKWFASSVFWKEHRLFAQLLYGTGMRISEGLQLRVKDLDFDHGTIIVREGKGSGLDVARELGTSLREQLSRARAWWLKDQAEAAAALRFPTPLSEVSARRAFLAVVLGLRSTHAFDRGAVSWRRHHMYDQTFQRAFKRAVEQAGINKAATPHPPPLVRDGLAPQRLRHSNRAGSARPFRRLYDDDLHACGKLAVPECAHFDALPPSLVR